MGNCVYVEDRVIRILQELLMGNVIVLIINVTRIGIIRFFSFVPNH